MDQFKLGRWTGIKGLAVLLAVSVLTAPLSAAQSHPSTAPQKSFEVATIRQTPPGSMIPAQWSPPGIGRFTATNVSLAFLIQMAFGIDSNQIEMPHWLESEHYDVAAKAEDGIALTREQLKPLMQNLLRQRFHLITHREIKPVHGYALVVAKKGPRLQPTSGGHPPGFRVYVAPGRLEGLNWSMQTLAAMLQHPAGRPVIDKTGITGSYDIKLNFAPDLTTESSLPSVFTALQETLGLKLKAEQVPVEMLVIDHVDKVPTEN